MYGATAGYTACDGHLLGLISVHGVPLRTNVDKSIHPHPLPGFGAEHTRTKFCYLTYAVFVSSIGLCLGPFLEAFSWLWIGFSPALVTAFLSKLRGL